MAHSISTVDPDGLAEFSVVFTDRSLNHMSKVFQQVMRDIHSLLCEVYNADAAVVVPGGGTFAMEAVARQFSGSKKCLVVRNGWFSYRWTQIFEACNIDVSHEVMIARKTSDDKDAPFAPAPIEEVVAAIKEQKPDVVFAPHVETAAGVILPDGYIKAMAEAVHSAGGLMVIDCIASGTIWLDMKELGIDVLVSAPQKGWSASPSAGLVMLSEQAASIMADTQSSSFAVDLKKWRQIMEAYLNGGHAYHATMPTDALRGFRDTMLETKEIGFDVIKERQRELGRRVREHLAQIGVKSVAAPGFEAPGVVVSYTDDPAIQNGSRFTAEGMQIAAGVPLQCNEPEDYKSFRLGLFGLDKLKDVDATVARLKEVLDVVIDNTPAEAAE